MTFDRIMTDPQAPAAPSMILDTEIGKPVKKEITVYEGTPGKFYLTAYAAIQNDATHTMCDTCGMVPVPFKHMPHRCGPCCYKVDDDKYNARPAVPYTGQPIHANEWDDEGYCFRDDELDDKIIGKLLDWKDEKLTIEQFKQHIHDLHIVQCRPEYLGQFDAGDHYQDVLPEDGELPKSVQDKVDELNEVIKAQGPVSWYPGKERITFEDSYIAEIYQCYCKEWDERFAEKESA